MIFKNPNSKQHDCFGTFFESRGNRLYCNSLFPSLIFRQTRKNNAPGLFHGCTEWKAMFGQNLVQKTVCINGWKYGEAIEYDISIFRDSNNYW